MPVTLEPDGVMTSQGLIRWPKFCTLLEAYLRETRAPGPVETAATDLRAQSFADEPLNSFIRLVCWWGGYPGIAGRILKRNTSAAIRAQFQIADHLLVGEAPDLLAALQAINQIIGLGRPSFASKHLRFLAPAYCPVLDSFIARDLGYPLTGTGYVQFADNCQQLALILSNLSIFNPSQRPNQIWFVADIEMALFQWVKDAHKTGLP